MKITFVITRTDEWLNNKAIKTGENHAKKVDVVVDTTALSEEQRSLLLAQQHDSTKFPERIECIKYSSSDYSLNCYGSYSEYLRSSADVPTQDDAIKAFDDAIDSIATARADYLMKQAEREEARRKKEEEKAARDKAYADARELLKSELDELEKVKEYRKVLSDVLSEIETDVINEAIEECDRTRQEVEDACTYNLNLDDDE